MPQPLPALEIERFADCDGAETIGWLVRYSDGLAIWCGEISRATFKVQSKEVRSALRDDMGWYLIEIEMRFPDLCASRVLARVADEDRGLDLAKAVALGRQVQLGADGH